MNNFNGYDLLELSITSNEGHTVDLRENLISLDIYSSLFDQSMSGQLMIADTFNLIDQLPIDGDEEVTVKWRTNGRSSTRTMKLMVYRVGERQIDAKIQGYTLYLTTPDMMINDNMEFSASFDGEYSGMISKILERLETPRELFVDQTTGISSQPIIIPFWSPLQAISWIAGRAMDANNNPCIFYENEEGYQFRALQTLYDQDPYCELSWSPRNAGDQDSEQSLHNLLSFHANGGKNSLDKAQCNILFADQVVYDFASKKSTSTKMDYQTTDLPTIDKNKVPVNQKINRNRSNHVFTKPDGSHNGEYNRAATLGMLTNLSYTAVTPGDSDMMCGMIVIFHIPSAEPLSNGRRLNETQSSGRMMITAMKHSFSKVQYTQTISLEKDSYGKVN